VQCKAHLYQMTRIRKQFNNETIAPEWQVKACVVVTSICHAYHAGHGGKCTVAACVCLCSAVPGDYMQQEDTIIPSAPATSMRGL
jgi:hypothetical protein